MPPACRLSGAEIARAAPISSTRLALAALALIALAVPRPAHAMHLADGILPLGWAALWSVVAAAGVAVGLVRLRQRVSDDRRVRPLVALVAALVFVLSCMPIPVPLVGTCSHPCGTGIAALLVGPWLTILVTVAALLLQALFLAHGGFTTLGADVVSMGIAGAFAGWGAFHALRRAGAPLGAAAFAAGLLSDWATYAVTSLELAAALHGARPFGVTAVTIFAAFLPTQIPIGIVEGLLAAGALGFLQRRRPDLLVRAGLAAAGEPA
jgi:cobalt/nickel transport system permease protein